MPRRALPPEEQPRHGETTTSPIRRQAALSEFSTAISNGLGCPTLAEDHRRAQELLTAAAPAVDQTPPSTDFYVAGERTPLPTPG